MSKTLAILDLEKALQIAANNRVLADDLLAMLIKSIPEYKNSIQQQAMLDRNVLKAIIHKIHGGLRYIGAPGLEDIISKTNNDLFTLSKKELQQNIELIFIEFDRLMKEEKYH